MESLRPALLENVEKGAPAVAWKEKEARISPNSSGNSTASPALEETVDVAAGSDASCYSDSEFAASEDNAWSVESDASSNAVSGESLLSDADSVAPACDDKEVKRCPSGSSIVTCDEAASKLHSEGDCKIVAEEKHPGRRAKRSQDDVQNAELNVSNNTVPRLAESAGKAWTEDKHCSYLNSIEATFVRSLYEQDYRGADMSEQDQDCVESRPMDPNFPSGCELFTSLQRGCYDQREYYKPHFMDIFSPAAVFASPWIQHFSPRMVVPGHLGGGGSHDVFAGHTTSGFAEIPPYRIVSEQGVVEEVKGSVPDTTEGSQGSNYRLESQMHASTSSAVNLDVCTQGKKRTCVGDPGGDGIMYRMKKLKSTQQKLAEIDLEMEEQFVLKQMNHKEEGNRTGGKDSGLLIVERTAGSIRVEDNVGTVTAILHESLSTQPKLTWSRTDVEEPSQNTEAFTGRNQADSRDTEDHETHECEPVSKNSLEPASQDDAADEKGTVQISDHHGTVSGNDCVGLENVGAPSHRAAGSRLKLPLELVSSNCRPDLGFDENEECKLVAKKSPRACRTYIWGLMGTRRPLHPGNVREDEPLGKEE